MIVSLAPMEGVTGSVFRRVHAACFGRLERYYAPFVAPPRVGSAFGPGVLAELDPARNRGLDVIPQLLTRDVDELAWAARLLAEMGYREVNLNLGCPAGVVVAKGKGSGLLRDPAGLEAFLRDACARSPIPVSVKTRIGVEDVGEYGRLLDAYCRLPLAELIVHPRVRAEFYRGVPHREAYGQTLERAPFPVAYNGDVFAPDDAERLLAAYPRTRHVMLGRGILANPALARMIAGGPPATAGELRRFHDRLFGAYEMEMGPKAVHRMKEWWFYASHSFADPAAVHRAVVRTLEPGEYRAVTEEVFCREPLADVARFRV